MFVSQPTSPFEVTVIQPPLNPLAPWRYSVPLIPVAWPPCAVRYFGRRTTFSSSVSLRSGCQNAGCGEPPVGARSGIITKRPSVSGCIQFTESNGSPVLVSWCVHLPSA